MNKALADMTGWFRVHAEQPEVLVAESHRLPIVGN